MRFLGGFKKEAPVAAVKPVDMGALIDEANAENIDREVIRTKLPDSPRSRFLLNEIFGGKNVPMSSEELVVLKEFLPASRKTV